MEPDSPGPVLVENTPVVAETPFNEQDLYTQEEMPPSPVYGMATTLAEEANVHRAMQNLREAELDVAVALNIAGKIPKGLYDWFVRVYNWTPGGMPVIWDLNENRLSMYPYFLQPGKEDWAPEWLRRSPEPIRVYASDSEVEE
jgi:hypothetical protein